MILTLSGRTHEVTTGFAIWRDRQERHAETVTTEVTFDTIARDRAARYCVGGEGRDKAGAYAIQGAGMALVRAIRGSYSNVVGLPAAEVWAALVRLGAAA
jgi:septum formation protein